MDYHPATRAAPRSRFDGAATLTPSVDDPRLSTQLGKVYAVMLDGDWHSLSGLEMAIGLTATQTAISARLRDLRKPRFGGNTIERHRGDDGLWFYKMTTRFPLLDGKDRTLDPPADTIKCPHCDGSGKLHRDADGVYGWKGDV